MYSFKSGWNTCEYNSQDQNKLFYQIHMPKNLEEGKSYPLILYMHGAGHGISKLIADTEGLMEWIFEQSLK